MHRTRRLIAGTVLALTGAATAAAFPSPGWANDGPDQFTITSDQLAEPVVVRAADSPRLAAALHSEVNWLSGKSGNSDELEEDARGPAYQLEVHIDGEARHRYVLYPLADGGPRVHRPEEQPGERTTTERWHFGRLSLPDTLMAAGVEIPGAQPRLPGGGAGGGSGAEPEQAAPVGDTAGVLATWREGLQLTALIALGIVLSLGTVAVLIRRKV